MEKGKLYIVGIGPGGREEITPRAAAAIAASDVVAGYAPYLKLLGDLIAGKETIASGMGSEVERCRRAVAAAAGGRTVSLVSSGDTGIYGMAGITLQVVAAQETAPEVEVIPGITAASTAAALLGAPLMHDFAVISLSDLLTPWSLIEKRLHLAGEGDFVVVLYNPRSQGREKQLERAREILLQYRKGETPVGLVRNGGRAGEEVTITVLARLLCCKVDMHSTVIIGNSRSIVWQDKIITPRGYAL
ncbi:MAG: precorrin-3B C(17)-methyltransferase [Bacillota bacterium]